MTEHATQATAAAGNQPHLIVESRPARLIAARYADLPFPPLGPMQEVAFDLGISALHGAVDLTGIIIEAYNEHQLLFEQRWPARILRQHTGEQDLHIAANTGLAVRHLHFMLHGYEPMTMVQVTVVGKRALDGLSTQALAQLPVVYHENKTDLHFPLRGAWWAIQGSDWSDRHKQEVFSQSYALDFVKLGPENHFFQGAGLRVEEHYSWDQPVYATAGGKVAYVCYDLPDLQVGQPPDGRMFRDDPRRLLGNAVAISHANGEFSFFGCLQQASITVHEGELIRRGTPLGRVGNSGITPGPHLHFHLMEGPNPFIDQGLPTKFSHFSAGGQFFTAPMTIPTRMIVLGPDAEAGEGEE